MSYIVDVNIERCEYTNERGQVYLISQREGHTYKGDPFVVKKKGKQIGLDYQGAYQLFDSSKVDALLGTNHLEANNPLENFSFYLIIPESNERLTYTWNPAGNVEKFVSPESR